MIPRAVKRQEEYAIVRSPRTPGHSLAKFQVGGVGSSRREVAVKQSFGTYRCGAYSARVTATIGRPRVATLGAGRTSVVGTRLEGRFPKTALGLLATGSARRRQGPSCRCDARAGLVAGDCDAVLARQGDSPATGRG